MLRAIRRNVRKGRITPQAALERLREQDPEPSPRIVRWLKGRTAWAMGRKRTGK